MRRPASPGTAGGRRPGLDEEEQLSVGMRRLAAVEQPRREHLDGVDRGPGCEAVGVVQRTDELGSQLGMTDPELHG